MDSVLIKLRDRDPPLYLHFDPPSGHYLVQECKRGACVFTPARAQRCISNLAGGEATWITEEIEVTGRLPRDSEQARNLMADLKTLPGYTR